MMSAVTDKPRPKINPAGEEILDLARHFKVTYELTDLDEFGNAITRLAGNDVLLDEPELLALALARAGHISEAEADRLHGAYLRAKYE